MCKSKRAFSVHTRIATGGREVAMFKFNIKSSKFPRFCSGTRKQDSFQNSGLNCEPFYTFSFQKRTLVCETSKSGSPANLYSECPKLE